MFQFFQHLPSNELSSDPFLEIDSFHDELVEQTEQGDPMEMGLHYQATQWNGTKKIRIRNLLEYR